VISVAALLLWLVNPFLALLAVPAAHAWIAATIADPRTRIGATFAAVAASTIPIAVAFVVLADRLEVGAGLPWHLLLMVAGGHLGPGTSLLACAFAGSLVAVVAAALAPSAAGSEPEISVRGPTAPPPPRTGVDDRRISDVQPLTLRRPRAD
jgi:hypothetical protein